MILAFEANSALSRENETKIVKITHSAAAAHFRPTSLTLHTTLEEVSWCTTQLCQINTRTKRTTTVCFNGHTQSKRPLLLEADGRGLSGLAIRQAFHFGVVCTVLRQKAILMLLVEKTVRSLPSARHGAAAARIGV